MKATQVLGQASNNKAKDYGVDGKISRDIYQFRRARCRWPWAANTARRSCR